MSIDYDFPYHLIARDVIEGRKVAVFCDHMTQMDQARRELLGALLDMGIERNEIKVPRDKHYILARGRKVDFLLTNGVDGRGMAADVVYLSRSARMQGEFALLMGGEAR